MDLDDQAAPVIEDQMGGKSPNLSLNSRDRSFYEQTFPEMTLASPVCFCFRESLGFNPISKAFSRQMQVRLQSCGCRNQAAWEMLLSTGRSPAAAPALLPAALRDRSLRGVGSGPGKSAPC